MTKLEKLRSHRASPRVTPTKVAPTPPPVAVGTDPES